MKESVMKKIPIQVSPENIKYMNDNQLSFAKILNNHIDNLRTQGSNISKDKIDGKKETVSK